MKVSFRAAIAVGLMIGTCCAGCKHDTGAVVSSVPSSPISPVVVAASGTLGSRISDLLARAPGLKGAKISVSVSNLDKAVVLSGTIAEAAQEKLAMRIAQTEAKSGKVVSQLKVQKRSSSVNKKMQLPAHQKR